MQMNVAEGEVISLTAYYDGLLQEITQKSHA